jgi:hypothetical protein
MKGFGLVLALMGCSVLASAEVYDLTTDFSTAVNPAPHAALSQNGVWDYGRSTGITTGYTRNTIQSTVASVFQGWAGPNGNLTDPFVGKAIAANAFNVPNGSVVLLPGNVSSGGVTYADLRWIAPTGGGQITNIQGSFGVGDTGAVDVYVVVQGVQQFGVVGTSTAANFNISTVFNVTAGQTVDFLVGAGTSGPSGDSTPLSGTITFTPVPEPASMAILGIGAAALIRRRRSSRK